MRDKDKKQVILDFLKHMETKDIHLTLFWKFKDNSMWSKDNPQPSHRTMINIQFKVDRLNENDKDVEIDKWLLNNWPNTLLVRTINTIRKGTVICSLFLLIVSR